MPKRPNIILVVMDSVRAANLSCYGYQRPTTPNIDLLAQQGAVFDQAISPGCWTLPVHASLFTGLYPLSHGVTISKNALPKGYPTLASHLAAVGYQTACFSNNAYISPATGLTQGFETVEQIWQSSHPRGTKPPRRMSKRLTQLEKQHAFLRPIIPVARALLRARSTAKTYIKDRKNRRDSGAALTNQRIQHWLSTRSEHDKPFFMFVNYMECHERYAPPHPYNRRFMPNQFSSWRVAQASASKERILGSPARRRVDDLEIIRALYDGALAYLDAQIGKLVQFLKEFGLLDDTVLVVTSDHGDSLGEHDQLGHRLTLYEPLVHVPLIVRYPAQFLPGTRLARQVQLGDLFPTLLDLAGAENSATHDFRSLLAPESDIHPFTVAENTAPKSLNNTVARMLRTDQYKYIWKSNQEHELYDLTHDPAEAHNLFAARPDLTRVLADQLERWELTLEGQHIEKSEAEFDEATLQHLRGLGYVG